MKRSPEGREAGGGSGSAAMPRRVALVTGGAGVIGSAIAKALTQEGMVVVTLDRLVDGRVSREAQSEDFGNQVQGEVTCERDVARALDECERLGTLAVAVNAAGIALVAPLLDSTMESFRTVLEVNLMGTYLVTREAARRMKPSACGSIVNVASTSAFMASTVPMSAYDASKAAVRQFTQSAARELGQWGIRVNAVAPSTIQSPLLAELGAHDSGVIRGSGDRQDAAGKTGITR